MLHEPVIVHSGRKEMSPSQSSMSSPCVSWWASLVSGSTQTTRCSPAGRQPASPLSMHAASIFSSHTSTGSLGKHSTG